MPELASSNARSALKMAVFGGLVAAAASTGARSTTRGLWYRALRKPSFQPPDEAFPVVWTALYALMATSGYRVSRAPGPGKAGALALWGAQLALNAAWTPLFFEKRRPRAAMVDLVALFATLGAYTRAAAKRDRPAAWMMAPYLAWVAFAGALNAEILRKNPALAR